MANLLSGLNYSLTLHGDLPVYGKDHRSKTSLATTVSAVTAPLRAQLLEATDLTPEQIPVITMGVDTEKFCVRPPTSNDRPKIVTVARLIAEKGHAIAFGALAKLKNDGIEFDYVVAGDGPEMESLKKLVCQMDLNDCVTLTGTIGEGEVRDLLNNCDAFLLPSYGLGEAAPVCVMEAMSCGIPVVCSLIGGTADMIENGVDGFLTPQKDSAAIAEALKKIILDADLAAEIGQQARATALAKFDYRINAARLLDSFFPGQRPHHTLKAKAASEKELQQLPV